MLVDIFSGLSRVNMLSGIYVFLVFGGLHLAYALGGVQMVSLTRWSFCVHHLNCLYLLHA